MYAYFVTWCRGAESESQLNSTDFVTNQFLLKLFNTDNMQTQTVELCREQFDLVLPSCQVAKLRDKFVNSDSSRINLLTLFKLQILHILYT